MGHVGRGAQNATGWLTHELGWVGSRIGLGPLRSNMNLCQRAPYSCNHDYFVIGYGYHIYLELSSAQSILFLLLYRFSYVSSALACLAHVKIVALHRALLVRRWVNIQAN